MDVQEGRCTDPDDPGVAEGPETKIFGQSERGFSAEAEYWAAVKAVAFSAYVVDDPEAGYE